MLDIPQANGNRSKSTTGNRLRPAHGGQALPVSPILPRADPQAVPEEYKKNSRVEYRDASGQWVAATVYSFTLDDKLEPYYEVGWERPGPTKTKP